MKISKLIAEGSCTILSDVPMVCPLCGITTEPMVAHHCELQQNKSPGSTRRIQQRAPKARKTDA